MFDVRESTKKIGSVRTVPLVDSVGMVLAHDVTEIRKDEFKGRAFKKGHVVRKEDIDHFRRIGKEHLFILSLNPDEIHEDGAALALAAALMGEGVRTGSEPKEGKVSIIADHDGILKVNREALLAFNMLDDVICATRHGNTLVKQGSVVAETKAIPLVVKRGVIERAKEISTRAIDAGSPILEVKKLRTPKVGIVITGNEVYHGRIKDSFASVITGKIGDFHGEVVGVYYAPDDRNFIEDRLRQLLKEGADLLIATGGMSVDPDDVTRFAIRNLGATDVTYGSAVLPGAMFLVAYLQRDADSGQKIELAAYDDKRSLTTNTCAPGSDIIPILGVPACGMYHKITVLDLVLPRILAGEKIGRRDLAELGYGGFCLHCKECRYPICPFGK
jgi:hypothetical protein